MSVLIKRMETPKNCDVCFMRDACEYSMPLGKRLTDCPLVEVPTPHGRLIDADAILGKIEAIIAQNEEEADLYEQDAVIVRDWLRSEPTVIESEEA